MKRTILSLAFAGSLLLAASACNSTKNVSGSTDSTSTVVDSTTTTKTTIDTAKKDTAKTTPPDTTKKM